MISNLTIQEKGHLCTTIPEFLDKNEEREIINFEKY